MPPLQGCPDAAAAVPGCRAAQQPPSLRDLDAAPEEAVAYSGCSSPLHPRPLCGLARLALCYSRHSRLQMVLLCPFHPYYHDRWHPLGQHGLLCLLLSDQVGPPLPLQRDRPSLPHQHLHRQQRTTHRSSLGTPELRARVHSWEGGGVVCCACCETVGWGCDLEWRKLLGTSSSSSSRSYSQQPAVTQALLPTLDCRFHCILVGWWAGACVNGRRGLQGSGGKVQDEEEEERGVGRQGRWRVGEGGV